MSVKAILDDFGTKLKVDVQHAIDADVKQNANKHGNDFGGNSRLAASVRFYYSSQATADDKIVFNLAMADYWEAFNDGRGAGKKAPPTKPIADWIRKRGIKVELSKKKSIEIKSTKDKGIKKQLKTQSRDKAINAMAFVIAKSIGKKGFAGNHFFDKIIKDGRIEKLKHDLSEFMKKEVIIAIRDGNSK